jgi:uncharacterized protein (DUF58 family)
MHPTVSSREPPLTPPGKHAPPAPVFHGGLQVQPAPAPVDGDRAGWRAFFLAMGALGGALVLALYSRVAAENAQVWLAGLTALSALGIAGWVAIRLVPVLARRTPLRWLALSMDYRVTREGLLFFGAVIVLAMAALNTGNNLLFLIVASMLAAILVSGVLSHLVLSGIELEMDLPEHIFAGQSVSALAQLSNRKRRLPSFSLRLCSAPPKAKRGQRPAAQILAQPVYFPHLPAGQTCRQSIEMQFPRRGVYREESLGLRTRFPFGFVEKTRRIDSALQVVVYPAIENVEEICQDWALVSGELESYTRGRGHDLYAIRAYQNSDSMRHVDWKASAKRNSLHVREFTREDQRQVLLVLDPFTPGNVAGPAGDRAFERAVSLCASLAWHFYEMDSVLGFRTAGHETPPQAAGDVIYDVLRQLAIAAPLPAETDSTFLAEMAEQSQVFRIIITRQPRGTIPASLWSSSFILFIDS